MLDSGYDDAEVLLWKLQLHKPIIKVPSGDERSILSLRICINTCFDFDV